jgi:hypothetical protein
VTAEGGCTWNASSTAPWITVISGSTGSGNGAVSVAIGATGAARSGTIAVAGQTVTVEQAAPVAPTCSYRLGEASRSVRSDRQDVTVTMSAPSGCAWKVTSDVSWITVADAGKGSGNGSVRLTVAANMGDARTGTVRIASETFTVQQAAGECTYAIKPTFYNAGRGPDTVIVNVTAGPGCGWTARSDAPWVSVDAGSSGSGNGTVRLQVQANSAEARTTVLTIAGQAFTLHQEGPCAYTLKPTFYHSGHGRDDITVEVNTEARCSWTASSSVAWVTVRDGASGSGNGKVRLRIEGNDGPARSVILTIAGQPFDLRQDGGK